MFPAQAARPNFASSFILLFSCAFVHCLDVLNVKCFCSAIRSRFTSFHHLMDPGVIVIPSSFFSFTSPFCCVPSKFNSCASYCWWLGRVVIWPPAEEISWRRDMFRSLSLRPLGRREGAKWNRFGLRFTRIFGSGKQWPSKVLPTSQTVSAPKD